ncbi:MAG TPA: TRAP transporter TatT component family protein, partial [Vicinamibacteria bacterium]
AVNSLGNALAEGSSTYAHDEDPDLVRDASPFALKTIESLLDASPEHQGLLLAAARGFTQYAYAFVEQEADFIEGQDLERSTYLRDRARKLYLRALDYGLRGLEKDLPGLREALRTNPEAALAKARRKHVPLLYWTANAWGAAIAISKSDSELTADQRAVEALMRRALALDESWELGSIHDFFISYEGSRSSVGGSLEEARQHLERALALANGRRAAPLVAYAEAVSVAAQDPAEFETLLRRALAVDSDRSPDFRLSNLIYQKRARWLLTQREALFVE